MPKGKARKLGIQPTTQLFKLSGLSVRAQMFEMGEDKVDALICKVKNLYDAIPPMMTMKMLVEEPPEEPEESHCSCLVSHNETHKFMCHVVERILETVVHKKPVTVDNQLFSNLPQYGDEKSTSVDQETQTECKKMEKT